MKRSSPHAAQAGSVFFLILVGIALFAALSYAMIQGGRSSTSNLSKDQARLAAQELMDYAVAMQKAVQSLRLRGCEETQFSFETTDEPWYNNPTAPSDKTCHLYDINGGKINFQTIDPDWVDEPDENSWSITSSTAVENIGTPDSELLMTAQDIDMAICLEINKILKIEPFEEQLPNLMGGFTGPYVVQSDTIGDESGSPYAGKSMGCLYDTAMTPDYGNFYAVLIAR